MFASTRIKESSFPDCKNHKRSTNRIYLILSAFSLLSLNLYKTQSLPFCQTSQNVLWFYDKPVRQRRLTANVNLHVAIIDIVHVKHSDWNIVLLLYLSILIGMSYFWNGSQNGPPEAPAWSKWPSCFSYRWEKKGRLKMSPKLPKMKISKTIQ